MDGGSACPTFYMNVPYLGLFNARAYICEYNDVIELLFCRYDVDRYYDPAL